MKTSQVRHLIKFMLLEDVAKVRHKVRTRGRETQRHVNFRSAGELEMGYGRKALAEKKDEMLLKLRRASRVAIDFTASQMQTLETAPRVDDFTRVNDLLSKASQVLLEAFQKDMVAMLEPFVKTTLPQHWCRFDDCGFDCGVVQRGVRYGLRVCLQNASNETLVLVNLRQRGTAAEAMRAKFDPTPFVPGAVSERKPALQEVDANREPRRSNAGFFESGRRPRASADARDGRFANAGMTRNVELLLDPDHKAVGDVAGVVDFVVGRDFAPSLGPRGDLFLNSFFARAAAPPRAPPDTIR